MWHYNELMSGTFVGRGVVWTMVDRCCGCIDGSRQRVVDEASQADRQDDGRCSRVLRRTRRALAIARHHPRPRRGRRPAHARPNPAHLS